MKNVMKILSALAAVVGVVYVIATYGDKIVKWAKGLLGCCSENDCEVVEEDFVEEEAAAEEAAPAEEAAEEATEEAAPVEEIAEEATEEVPAE